MKKILVVVDMQNDFITGPLGPDPCVPVIPAAVSTLHNGGCDQLILTYAPPQRDYLQTQEGQKLPIPHCIEGTHGWGIVPEVWEVAKTAVVINKPTFGSTVLGELLRKYSENSDESIEIDFCGVCTGICVISNVMIAKAFVPEAKVCVIEKACACVTPQSHQTAIEAMKTCQVNIIK